MFVPVTALAANIGEKSHVIIKGRVGSENGQFGFKILNDGSCISPSAIAIDAIGNIYIADPFNDRIQKFDSTGKFVSKIIYPVSKKRYEQTIDDITTDDNNNLYVASRHEGKISKYSPDGRLLLSIRLDDKDLRWRAKWGWHSGSFQIHRITVDVESNIYLEGIDELIKFDKSGTVSKKWAPVEYPVFVLDPLGNLILSKRGEVIEKYDNDGKLLESGKCGELHSWIDRGHCYLPQHIDRNDFLYWFEKNGSVVIKADRDGRRAGEMQIPSVDVYDNTVKFGQNGNLYILRSSNTEFWVEKYSWR